MGIMKSKTNRAMIAGLVVSTAVIGTGAETASAELIAYWHFNNYPGLSVPPNPTPADVGSGSIRWYPEGGPIEVQGLGTNLNALPGYEGTQAVVLGAFFGTSRMVDFDISMADMKDLTVSYATMGTPLSWKSHRWQWSLDGVNFTEAASATVNVNQAWQRITIDFSSVAALTNAAQVTLRLVLDDAVIDNVGFTWVDNFQMHGTLIPAPGVLALLGIAGMMGQTRRRRRV